MRARPRDQHALPARDGVAAAEVEPALLWKLALRNGDETGDARFGSEQVVRRRFQLPGRCRCSRRWRPSCAGRTGRRSPCPWPADPPTRRCSRALAPSSVSQSVVDPGARLLDAQGEFVRPPGRLGGGRLCEVTREFLELRQGFLPTGAVRRIRSRKACPPGSGPEPADRPSPGCRSTSTVSSRGLAAKARHACFNVHRQAARLPLSTVETNRGSSASSRSDVVPVQKMPADPGQRQGRVEGMARLLDKLRET